MSQANISDAEVMTIEPLLQQFLFFSRFYLAIVFFLLILYLISRKVASRSIVNPFDAMLFHGTIQDEQDIIDGS